MSLDIYLEEVGPRDACACAGACPCHTSETHEVYHANITHNLSCMAEAAGIYECLWHPERAGITAAEQLIPLLEKGLWLLRYSPDRFALLNAANGWGLYENFLPWVDRLLDACRTHPGARVQASR